MNHVPESQTFNAINIRNIDVGGQQIRIATKPGRSDVPLIIFNGIGAHLELLEPFLTELRDVETITLDIPGVGGSPPPNLPYSLSGMASLIGDLLDELGVKNVDVLGVSWGGMLAQQFAFQYPQRCRKLVLACTGVGAFGVPGNPSVMRKLLNPLRFIFPNYNTKQVDEILGIPERTEEKVPDRRAPNLKETRGYTYQLMAMTGWTSAFWLHLLRQPTLILAGSNDQVTPLANAWMLSLAIRDSSLRVFEDGHMLLLSSAGPSARAVEEFLLA